MIEPPLDIDSTGKVIMITDTGSVLCGEIARAFARAGIKVAALDLSEEVVEKLSGACRAGGLVYEGCKTDVLSPEALAEAHAQVCRTPGPCDTLINDAGGNNPRVTTGNKYQHEAKPSQKTFLDLDTNGMDFVFKLNFQGTLLPTQAPVEGMVKRGSGYISNISFMNTYTPLTRIPAYSSTKAAINNFTQWLATYFAGTGVRCNAIAPGFLVSSQNRKLLSNEDGTPTPRTARILADTPMGRFVESNELLGGTFFFCDDRTVSAITDVVLSIDAGFAAYSGV